MTQFARTRAPEPNSPPDIIRTITLLADNNQFLSLMNNDAVGSNPIDAAKPAHDRYCMFVPEHMHKDTWVFKADNGRYWKVNTSAEFPNQIEANGDGKADECLFKVEFYVNNMIAIRGFNDLYVSRIDYATTGLNPIQAVKNFPDLFCRFQWWNRKL
jgi:hypothetical protein